MNAQYKEYLIESVDDGFFALSAAIVVLAKNDYRRSFKRFIEFGDDRDRSELRRVCNFFYSKHGEILCVGKNKEVFDLLVEKCTIDYGYIPDSVCAYRRLDEDNFSYTP